jgi:sulfatase modifying factor 1
MQPIPGAAFEFEMVPIPGAGDLAKGIEPFWISRCEVTWEAFDAFVYPRDGAADAIDALPGVDAVTRPSKPYLPPDRGFGHEGYAAICMSHGNAEAFCEWLSVVSGRTYRLPTEAEWEHACRAGSDGEFAFADDEDVSQLDDHAWYKKNSEGVPHPVGTKLANAWGLYDMHGNVAEWVNGRDGSPVVKGGSYRSDMEMLKASARQLETNAWNASDPQIPKSQWWLADAPFVGFRVVCEVRNVETSKGRKVETSGAQPFSRAPESAEGSARVARGGYDD